MPRAARLWSALGLTAVVSITFVFVRIAVLNVFYTTGDMHDPGWLAYVVWHNGWQLHGPAGFPGPFFSEHIVPIYWVFNAASYIVPLSRYEYFAVCLAAIHALYAAGVWRAWMLTEPRVTVASSGIAAIVALAATFSGIAVVALQLPHTELAIPAFALWFAIAVAQRKYVAAALWFVACLAVREDAGLHLFGLLVLWAGVLAWRRRGLGPDIRWLLAFAAIGFCYSAMAFAAKHVEFPHGDILTRSYLGNPPFHHVTGPFIEERARLWLRKLSYVGLPMLLTFLWAAIVRDPLLPLGYIAVLPWLVFNLLAVHDTPGQLGYYYGFPLWLSLAWPLVAWRIGRDNWDVMRRRWPYALLLMTSVAGWNWNHVAIYAAEPGRYGTQPFAWYDTLTGRDRYQAFNDYYLAHRDAFGVAAFDQAVFGLLIDHADRGTWLDPWTPAQPPDTIIYFTHGFEWQSQVLPRLRTGLYRCIYMVPGTRIQVASQNALSERLPLPLPMQLVSGSLDTRC